MSIEIKDKDIKVVIYALINASKMPYQVAFDTLMDEVQDWELENFVNRIINKVSNKGD